MMDGAWPFTAGSDLPLDALNTIKWSIDIYENTEGG